MALSSQAAFRPVSVCRSHTGTAFKPADNRFLAALEPTDRDLVLPLLTLIRLRKGELHYECSRDAHLIYFPVDAVLSMRHVLLDGHSCDVARVGREGMLALILFRHAAASPYCTQVQIPGWAYRANAAQLLEVAEGSLSLHALLLQGFYALVMQIGQSVACNRYHTIQQQLSRCLLQMLDRVSGVSLDLTHEQLGASIGVRREGVSEAAARLQRMGLIRYQHGHIEVLDRVGLEAQSCECYRSIKLKSRARA
jgi:CRP-like cAMP-binding protein